MSEVKKPLIKLVEGTQHRCGAEEYLITEDHSLSDIVRFLIQESNDEPDSVLLLVWDELVRTGDFTVVPKTPTEEMLAKLVYSDKWASPRGENTQYIDPADAYRELVAVG